MIFDADTLNRLFRYCTALCGERENARDLLHDAIEKYLRNNTKSIQNVEAYIRQIARNAFIDQLRKNHIEVVEEPIDFDVISTSEKTLETMIVDKLTLEQTWKMLSPLERETIFLWAVDGMSASEIALHIGQSRNTVLSRLYRLRLRLKEIELAPKAGGAS